ncbi:plasmid mobilization protein [Fusobacterium polymorphum]|mgnify:CR=1 FL=1|uniref:plasmid mobilization protein n=1 Tax=Fusobacterium nucleatum subsp. polymorphum TaxID=76857 RepID=UPI0030CDB238
MYNKQLKFRTNEEIKNKVLLKSKLLNISYAEYLRLLIQDDEKRNFIGEIIEFKNVLRELKIELNYIGNNLNQLSKKVNSNLNVELDEVLKVQENLSNILQRLGGQKKYASINENSREQEKE